MDKMDAGRVMRAIQMLGLIVLLILTLILILMMFMMRLSERCLSNRGVEKENLEKLKEGVEGLDEVMGGLAQFLESELVGDEAFRLEPFDKDEGGLWFSFQVKDWPWIAVAVGSAVSKEVLSKEEDPELSSGANIQHQLQF